MRYNGALAHESEDPMRTVVGWLASLSLIATTTVVMTTVAVAQQSSRPAGTAQQRPVQSGKSTFSAEAHGNLNKENDSKTFELHGGPKSGDARRNGGRPSGSGGMFKEKEKE